VGSKGLKNLTAHESNRTVAVEPAEIRVPGIVIFWGGGGAKRTEAPSTWRQHVPEQEEKDQDTLP